MCGTSGRTTVRKIIKIINRKLGDGLFLKKCREISQKYPSIIYLEENLNTLCMKLSRNPSNFDVLVMPNLYGDMIGNLCSGFIGGYGFTYYGNIGTDAAVFEIAHNYDSELTVKNLLNPTAFIMTSVMVILKFYL
jgi:isocitrate dehydrogenase (NAD+)